MPPQNPVAPMPAAPPVAPQPIAPIQASAPQPAMQLDPAYSHTGLATASLVLGIVSLPASILNLYTLPIPVTAIVLGVISLKRKKSFAIAGIVLGVIGIILSAVVIILGSKMDKDKKAGGTSTSKVASGDKITSTCYEFNLPQGLTNKDVQTNSDCMTVAVNATSSEDFAVQSSAVSDKTLTTDRDALLKRIVDEVVLRAGSKVKISASKYTTVDGERAYQATGTEIAGNYKYLSILAVVSPKPYVSKTGEKLRGFLFVSDSAISSDAVEKVAESWHWQ